VLTLVSVFIFVLKIIVCDCGSFLIYIGKINLKHEETDTQFDVYCRQFLPWVEAKLELEWPKGDI
jgi:hypothetical protein